LKPKKIKEILRAFKVRVCAYAAILGVIAISNSCIEPYDFRVKNETPNLVVEGFISNVSYNQSLDFPSCGRYFEIKLSYTNDVINIRGESISSAVVELYDDQGNSWQYTGIQEESTVYRLLDPTFRALADRMYKLKIILKEGDMYESDWVSLPNQDISSIGNVGFNEEEIETYVNIAGEDEIRSIEGINATIELPVNNSEEPIYYRWTYDPTWVYIAPLASIVEPISKCWAKNPYYLSGFELQEDFRGGYERELFFINTIGNERIYESFSVLINQQVMNRDFFFFWKEIKEKASGNALFDKQPFNLSTNFKPINNDNKVSGYFDVVQEQATRWYFNKDDLSYRVLDDILDNCIQYQGPDGPAPECLNCLEYSNGNATSERPNWWKED